MNNNTLTTRNRKYTAAKYSIKERLTVNHFLRQCRPADTEKFAATVREVLADHGLSRTEFAEAMEQHGLRIPKDACLVHLLEGVARVWSVCAHTSDRSIDVITL